MTTQEMVDLNKQLIADVMRCIANCAICAIRFAKNIA